MSLPAIAFFAFTCIVCVLIEIYAMWWRIDHLRDDHEAITRELADMWTFYGQVADWIEYLAGDEAEQPTTTPQPVTGPDTQPSHALVIGGARVTGKPTPYARKADTAWVDDRIEQYRKTGSWK